MCINIKTLQTGFTYAVLSFQRVAAENPRFVRCHSVLIDAYIKIKTKELRFFKIGVNIYQSVQRDMPQDLNLQSVQRDIPQNLNLQSP